MKAKIPGLKFKNDLLVGISKDTAKIITLIKTKNVQLIASHHRHQWGDLINEPTLRNSLIDVFKNKQIKDTRNARILCLQGWDKSIDDSIHFIQD